jgi:hypothetical protein
MEKGIDLDTLYEDFVELLNSFTDEKLDEWLEFDRKRLEESKEE